AISSFRRSLPQSLGQTLHEPSIASSRSTRRSSSPVLSSVRYFGDILVLDIFDVFEPCRAQAPEPASARIFIRYIIGDDRSRELPGKVHLGINGQRSHSRLAKHQHASPKKEHDPHYTHRYRHIP